MLGLLIVVVELTVLAALALLLHRGSERWGLAPLLAFLSGLAVLAQGTNYVYVISTAPPLVLNGSALFVSVIFLAVLVLYSIDGAVAARQAVMAIVGLSLLVFYVAAFNRLRIAWLGPDSVVSLAPGPRVVLQPAIVLASITAFAVGLHAVVLSYQLLCNRTPRSARWLAPGVAILVGLWVDALCFSLLYSLPELARFGPRLARDLVGKTAAAALLWPLAAVYLARASRWKPLKPEQPRPLLELLFGRLGRIELDLSRARGDLRQERDLLTRLMATSPVGIVRVDRSGRIVFANDQAERVLGLVPSEITARRYDDPEWRITDEEGAPYPDEHLPFRRVRDTRAPVYGIRHAISWSSGRRVIVSVNAAPLLDGAGEFDGMVAVVDDITERRRGEAERELLIRELEAKNAELERFTYTVSHDLKSPLVTIRGFLGFLAGAARRGDVQQLDADVQRIEDAAERMERLLNELLELSRIGRQMNAARPVPFEAVAREAVSLVDGRLSARGVEVVIGPDLPVVLGDRSRLVQVVQNLLDNAVKFMGKAAQPRVEVGCRAGAAGSPPVLFVRDNGIGIDARHLETVFGLFDKIDARSEGTGVGLALVKRIVETHGGRVWVESEGEGHGACFCLALPVAPQQGEGTDAR